MNPGHKTMPDFIGVLGKRNPLHFFLTAQIEDADFHLRCVGGKHGKVCAFAIPCRAPRVRQPFLHCAGLNLGRLYQRRLQPGRLRWCGWPKALRDPTFVC